MDFEFFERLGEDDARTFLEEYLRSGASSMSDLAERLSAGGVHLDHSLESIRPAFEQAAGLMATVSAETPEPHPEWIGPVEDIELDADSRVLAVSLSYYLGETFVRHGNGRLRWTTGDPETAIQQQPVVSGFKHRIQMAPLLVTENLLLRLLCDDDDAAASIDTAISHWQGLMRV